MGNYISRIFNNICSMCKYTSCRSSCCNDNIEVDIDNKRKQKDTETNINCCWGCLEYSTESYIHSNHKTE